MHNTPSDRVQRPLKGAAPTSKTLAVPAKAPHHYPFGEHVACPSAPPPHTAKNKNRRPRRICDLIVREGGVEPPLHHWNTDLNSAGHFTARGSEFSVDAVRYLLANPLYCGYIKHYASGELYPVQGEAFPPIVGEQTWRAAVAKLEDNVRRSARQGNQPKYLLSTIGLCGKCGATLVSGTNSRKQPTYRCGEQFHLTHQREPVDAMVTEAVLTRLSSVDVHDLVMPQEDDGPDREELLTERNALVDRVKELSPLLRDIHQPVLEITAAINDVKARIDEIDAELLDRSVSAAAKLLADVEEPVGTAERREVVEAKWKVLDVDRRRMLVDELVTVTIEPITPGHVKFDPDLIRIEPRRD